jgi:hypothetical protein
LQNCTEEKKRLSIIWNSFSVLKKRTENMERYTQLITLCTDKVDKNIFCVPYLGTEHISPRFLCRLEESRTMNIWDISVLGTGHLGTGNLLCNQNRNENNHPVKFICDLLIKGLIYQNKSYLQILMNSLFDVHLIKDD